MTEITKEMLEKAYKNNRSAVKGSLIYDFILFILYFIFIFYISDNIPDEKRVLVKTAAFFAVIITSVIIAAISKKRITPSGNGRIVMDTYKQIQNDFISDKAIGIVYQAIQRTTAPADRIKLQLFLVDIFLFRGQYNESINIINTIDRSCFEKYPDIAVAFYNDTIAVYSYIGDNASVIAAYEDAERFLNNKTLSNYITCKTAVSLLIDVHKARGDYRKALDMRLMMNEFENKFNKDIASYASSAVNKNNIALLVKGQIFYSTAELFYLNGDYSNAARYLDIGGPLLAMSPVDLQRANKLSAEIRSHLSGNS